MPTTPRFRAAMMIGGIAVIIALFAGWSAHVARTFRRHSAVVGEVPVRQGMTLSSRVAAPPPVEPLILRDLTMDDARAANERVPFASGAVTPAAPFKLAGTDVDRESATTCLASAAYYEAGDDPVGQQAVVQVVLNRLRHPAYPKTVCGVVFQGSERSTGCQFTFTCDGALARVPPAPAWLRARGVASKALGGAVFPAVGTATHYHTDWVVPYWSATLDKIARVHTHLFFRWRGGWGQPAAFRRPYAGSERIDPRIAALIDPASRAMVLGSAAIGDPVDAALAPGPVSAPAERPGERPPLVFEGLSPAQLKGNVLRLADPATSEFVLQLNQTEMPGSYAIAALNICHGRPTCRVIGWADAARIPAALPVKLPALRSASFLYRRFGRIEQVHWNCRTFPRDDPKQCLPGTGPQPAAAAPRNDEAPNAL